MPNLNCILLMLVLSLASLGLVSCGDYFIVPTQNSTCFVEPCRTLSQFANTSVNYSDSNITLIIFGGDHHLEFEISISNIEDFYMLPMNKTNSSAISITCNEFSRFIFANVDRVHISGMTFIGCDGTSFESIDQLIIEGARFMGQNNRVTLLTVDECNMKVTDTDFRHNNIIAGTMRSFGPSVGGALIVSNSTLTVDNCQFVGNGANIGGAIFSESSSSVTISDCYFFSNRATGCANEMCSGGALFFNGTGTVIIRNSTFENNLSNQGGAVAVINSQVKKSTYEKILLPSTITVEATNFTKNVAMLSGGAMYVYGSSATIRECLFSRNRATGFGGVLSAEMESSVLVDGCMVHNSNATSGGALYATAFTNITIVNSTFDHNEAERLGGVLLLVKNSTNRISNSTFTDNRAGFIGGVIHVEESGTAVLYYSNFSYNEATDHGGVAGVRYRGELVFNKSFFDHNSASSGGVFDVYSSSNIEVYGSSFNNNAANIQGGVILVQMDSRFIVEDSEFTNHINVDLGAIIRALNGNVVVIHNSNFTNNSANYGGVAIMTINNTISITNSRFHDNNANNDGGVLYTRILGRVTIDKSLFVRNQAINDGIVLSTDGSLITINSTTFIDNVAGHDGGVAYAYNKTSITISNCTIVNNRAENSGGIAYVRNNCTIAVVGNFIDGNRAQSSGGGVHAQDESHICIEGSNFNNNRADYGGGFRVYVSSTANISNSNFSENVARVAGGAMATYERSTITVYECKFISNSANVGGGLIALQNFVSEDSNTTVSDGVMKSIVDVKRSNFENNTAALSGGVMYIQGSTVAIESCSFDQNQARYDGADVDANSNSVVNISNSFFANSFAGRDGGVLFLIGGTSTNIQNCIFNNAGVISNGGVAYISESNAIISGSIFHSSKAVELGGALFASNGSVQFENSTFASNTAYRGGAMYTSANTTLKVQESNFIDNIANHSGGALYIVQFSNGDVIDSVFRLNKAGERGGAICTTEMSKVSIAASDFSHNMAERGAALSVRRMSSISFDTIIGNNMSITGANQIYNNTAKISGGGIYLSEGDLYFGMETYVSHNQASTSGGGIFAANSSITIKSDVDFKSNRANEGGGMSLQNSKISQGDVCDELMNSDVNFVSNWADYGGALYIDDKNEESVCSSNPFVREYSIASGCFFKNITKGLMINFGNNYAYSSGRDLYGGLLDRCTVVSDTNTPGLEPIGVVRFKEISNITNLVTVSSNPIRLCLCESNDSEPDCAHTLFSIQVKNKDDFSIRVAAVDQVNHTVPATVQSRFEDLNLAESQSIRRIDATCSKLEYRVSFPNVSEIYNLTVFPEGPCGDKGISKLIVSIHVISCSCPPGFVSADTDLECACICDSRYETFSNYIQECNSSSESVIRRGRFWIKYFNDTDDGESDPYFIYPFCPFDYCQPPSTSVRVNLRIPNGSDAQCRNNRGGILCGSCRPTYSLSLGSSKCVKCQGKWHGRLEGILIASFLSGIILVFFLLMFNVTVAVGTLNSIIFYANIIYVNRSVYFSQPHLTFVPVFISWLNLDVGFDTCFFEGMDAYAKTWLQLAFPLYIILLVVVIISVSSCSSRFSNLIGKRDPVATLATLILLSYTKLLQVIIASFSFVTLKYPNGKIATHWLPDASIEYSEGKLIALVVVAIIILTLGLLYTTLIFSWQWLLRLSRLKLFSWTRNQKLHTFIDTYHAPYSGKHRYWTGLLLLIRVILYLVYAFTVSVDPQITLLFTVVIAV